MKLTIVIALLIPVANVFAGPPIICQRVAIGNAQSLPWRDGTGWNGADPAYDTHRLVADTLSLLTADTPLAVHMETLRRAAVYAAKEEVLPERLQARLLARAADSESAGKPAAMAWFDAGYFAEAMRQIAFVQRYMGARKDASWAWNGDTWVLDGKPWIERAERLGARGLETALAKINEVRQADLKRMELAAR